MQRAVSPVRYAVAVVALAAGCWAIYQKDVKVGAGLIGFAGLIVDPQDVKEALVSVVSVWKPKS